MSTIEQRGRVQYDPALIGDVPMPVVTFAIDMGEHVKQIDFDYDTYIADMQKRGLGDIAIANTQIDFITEPIDAGVDGTTSSAFYENAIDNEDHDQLTRTIGLDVVSPQGRRGNPNKQLAHETQHQLDQHAGIVDDMKPAREVLADQLYDFMVDPGGSEFTLEELQRRQERIYAMSSTEQRARIAEKRPAKVITVKRKSALGKRFKAN